MKSLTIIPVKNLNDTKTRLKFILDLKTRQELTLKILTRTFGVLKSCKKIDSILVISPDPRILLFAGEQDILGLSEDCGDLNGALDQATSWAVDNGFKQLLIVPADIPFLQKSDIENILHMGSQEDTIVVIASDCDSRGTNALLVKPPGIMDYCFGVDSFSCHLRQAMNRRIHIKIYSSETVGFDIDFPEHYRLFQEKCALNKMEDNCGYKSCYTDTAARYAIDPAGR